MSEARFTRPLLSTAHRRAMSIAYDAGFRPAPKLADLQRAASVVRPRGWGEQVWRVRIQPATMPHDSLTPRAALAEFRHAGPARDAYEARARAWNAWCDRLRETGHA
jgi:hypothetical protein